MYNFKFIKPYYPEVEILELFNISKSTLQRYRAEALKGGETLWEAIGYFHIDGIKSAMYEPVKLSNWILKNKINTKTNYNHDVAEKETLREGLLLLANINQNQQIKKVSN